MADRLETSGTNFVLFLIPFCSRLEAKTASLSLQLPHSDLSFVESDSDGEWSNGLIRRRNNPARSRGLQRNSNFLTDDKSVQNSNGTLHRIRQGVSEGVGAFCNSPASDVTTKLLWLSVFHSAASRRAVQFECMTVICPWAVRMFTILTPFQSCAELPRPIPKVLEFLESCAIPAVISLVYQGFRWFFRPSPTAPVDSSNLLTPLYTNGDQLREAILAMDLSMERLVLIVNERQPQTAAQYAEIFKSVITTFKRTLDRQQLETCKRLAARFNNSDAELMRYLLANNLLEARTNEDIEKVFRVTGMKLNETIHWIGQFGFISDGVIKRHWGGLVFWTKRLESGHPVLLVRLGLAIETCHGEKAEEYGRAIISQVDRGVRRLLKNDYFVDTLITILDCDGASTANLNRIYGLLHSVPVLLNKHYPGRLKHMHLVNVPLMMRWLIQLVKKFLHPMTQNKIIVYGRDLELLPGELREILELGNDRRFLPSTSGSQAM
eukprot:g9274.t1